MGVLPPLEGSGRRKALRGFSFLLSFTLLAGCGAISPRKNTIEEILKRDLRSFHWALMGGDIAVALRHVQPDDRDGWEEVFTCLFERLRLVDYRVSLVKFGERSKEATVQVRWTTHPLDSLVVGDMVWREKWSYSRPKQRWTLVPAPDSLKGLPMDCLPELTDGESAHGDRLVNRRHPLQGVGLVGGVRHNFLPETTRHATPLFRVLPDHIGERYGTKDLRRLRGDSPPEIIECA